MKIRIFCILALVMALAGCTNNGDIGELYGEWALEEYTIDGKPAIDNPREYFWRFQNDIIQVTHALPLHEFEINTGLWRRQGDKLVLTLSDTDAKEIAEDLSLEGKETELKIETLTGKAMVLKSVSSPQRIYKLKKIK